MASKDSAELNVNERYPLGDYSFRIERSAGTSPGYDKIEAICTKGGKNARKSIQIPSSMQLDGWDVEATETEATVYVKLNEQISPFPYAPVATVSGHGSGIYTTNTYADTNVTVIMNEGYLASADSPGNVLTITHGADGHVNTHPLNSVVTKNGKTAYYVYVSSTWTMDSASPSTNRVGSNADMAWYMAYGNTATKTLLVGRFAIDIKDAGGVGPGSDWDDPEDYDEDWEPEDPTHTLYVEVTGALSGRHNDPIVDPSYSYIPADKNTIKDYGCGGDGGHGGGGGAGASTVVVHKFATNQANSKEVTAIARRHGYGSGGGKGGKGGDGCILVYY